MWPPPFAERPLTVCVPASFADALTLGDARREPTSEIIRLRPKWNKWELAIITTRSSTGHIRLFEWQGNIMALYLLDPSIKLSYHSLGKTYLIFSGERIVIDRAEKRDVKAPQRSRKREDRR